MKCSTATSITAIGWSKSSSRRTSGVVRMRSGWRRSSWTTVAPVVAGQDLPAVRHRDRVDVDVDHPGVRGAPLGDLVHVADGRDAGADVEELADAARPTRNCTARRRKARLAWRHQRARPAPTAIIAWAAARSTAKLCDPPR